ncbi:hypothetical protein CEXT_243871 [Caerostris extrusa]|uniref:Uncharacterized protein n=1 Tax=Caerostris extrusa TaxID=172846 RepID=A0AAV4UHV9_CAEEX|nr:hypothetical protein CEXT_243871 [Caerostris extrusa]
MENTSAMLQNKKEYKRNLCQPHKPRSEQASNAREKEFATLRIPERVRGGRGWEKSLTHKVISSVCEFGTICDLLRKGKLIQKEKENMFVLTTLQMEN